MTSAPEYSSQFSTARWIGMILILLLAAAFYLATLIGLLLSLAGFPAFGNLIWPALTPGLFLVWVPTLLVMFAFNGFGPAVNAWKVIALACPRWLRVVLGLTLAAALLSYLRVQAFFHPGHVAMPAIQFLGPTLLFFYCVAFCTMNSSIRAPQLLIRRVCPHGHYVGPTDAFCPHCGTRNTFVPN